MLLQEICARNLDWDSLLPGDLENKWKHWLQNLRQAKYVMISRCLYDGIQEEVQSCSLHGFGDASKKAYCAVVYMLVRTSIGSYVRLIASKTRVAPNKNYTIPRLELLSGLILARLVSVVREALGQQVVLDEIHLWLDSITAVYWITGNKEWKQFVQNRVDEILRLTIREMWHHCPGVTNPADIGSRGELPETLKENELWWSGPIWLSEPESSWPSSDVLTDCPTDECMMEARKKQVSDSVEKTQVTLTVDNNVLNLEEIIDPKKYSDSKHLFQVTAWVLRFVHNLKSRIDISTEEQIYKTELLNCEIWKAETLWLKTVQKTVKSEPNYRQVEHDLGLFEDEDGVLRCDGRIGNVEISEEAKFPALVPKNCSLVELLIRSSHKRVYHCKVSSTLAELRTRYWIPSGRQVVKKVLSKCCVCRRYEGASYRGPPKVNLPKCRLNQEPAFSHVGVDFAGPLYIKDSKDSNMQKAYIALFSCCSSRALHLELTTDLSAETFIRSLRRFTSRGGVPELIISDNAKTFTVAKKLLNKIFNHPSVRRFCTSKRISWRFNVDRAPWWGGFFKRMVQEVKRCLRKTLRNAKLNYDELHTVLVEIEGTLNSRPLTYVSSDEIDDPITPSHLVVGRRISSIPIVFSAKIEEVDDSSSGVEARRNYLRKILTHFWTRWSREYVTDLRARDWMKRRAGNLTISTDDVVTVHEDGQPRGLWRLGKVESLIPGKDGEIRAAVVRVKSKKGQTTLLKTPIQKLFPLELFSKRQMQNDEPHQRNDVPDQGNDEPDQKNDEPVQENVGSHRPRQAAALDADYIRRLIDQ